MGLTERRTGRLAALEGLEAALQVGDTAGAEVDTDRLGEAISGRVVGMETTEIQNELGTEEPGGPRGGREPRVLFFYVSLFLSLCLAIRPLIWQVSSVGAHRPCLARALVGALITDWRFPRGGGACKCMWSRPFFFSPHSLISRTFRSHPYLCCCAHGRWVSVSCCVSSHVCYQGL